MYIKIPHININVKDYNVNIQMENIYNVDDEIIIINYKISDSLNNFTYIPYYISNGNTNGLRMNGLLPFMCLHTKDSLSCPRVYCGKYCDNFQLLFKYHLCKNINVDFINRHIIDKIYGIDFRKNRDFKLLHYFNQYNGSGLLSVLTRISNILDFIIFLSSHKLKKYEDNIMIEKKFIPINSKNILVYDEDTDGNIINNEDFDKTYLGKLIKEKEDGTGIIDGIEWNNKNNNIYDINNLSMSFRQYLLYNLFYIKNIFIENEIIKNITYNDVEIPNKISRNEFNNKLKFNICVNRKINDNANLNLEKYMEISYLLYSKIKDLNIIKLKNILHDLKDCRFRSLTDNVEIWNATCKQVIKCNPTCVEKRKREED